MNRNEFCKRWIMGCVDPPFFYLPYKKRKGNIVINPVTHIHDKRISSRQYFVPYMDDPHTTGEITIFNGYNQEETPTEGCEYRIYRKITHADGSFEYIAVNENGELDPNEEQPMLKNKQTLKLPLGTYYYKEYISAEGDILHFKPVKFEVKSSDMNIKEPREITIDHKPKLAKCYVKFKETIDYFEIKGDDISGRKQTTSPNGFGAWGYSTTAFGSPILLKDYAERKLKEGTTDDFKEITYKLMSSGAGEVKEQKIIQNPVHKIVPEIYSIKYMDKDYTHLITKEPSMNYDESHIYFNESGNISTYYYAGIGIEYYFNDFECIKLSNNTRSNPDLYISDVLVHHGHVMLYSEYQRFSRLSGEETDYLYFNENYKTTTANQNNSTSINQGFVIVSDNVRIMRGSNPFNETIYNYVPQKVIEVKDKCDTYVSDGIYLLGMKTPKYKYIKTETDYDGKWDFWYYRSGVASIELPRTNIRQGQEPYFCETHKRWEEKYFIDEYTVYPPDIANVIETVTEYGGNTALGFACAEDCGGASMWACKVITQEDPDTNGGFQPRYTAPDTALYLTITLYEKGDEYLTVLKTYDASKGLLFPQISPHTIKQAERETEYGALEAHKGYEKACNVATVFVRQTRDNYASWFGVTEPTDWDDEIYG